MRPVDKEPGSSCNKKYHDIRSEIKDLVPACNLRQVPSGEAIPSQDVRPQLGRGGLEGTGPTGAVGS